MNRHLDDKKKGNVGMTVIVLGLLVTVTEDQPKKRNMKSWRENPDGPENTEATKQTEREIFALKMQARQDSEHCETCGMLKSQCDCWDAVNGVA